METEVREFKEVSRRIIPPRGPHHPRVRTDGHDIVDQWYAEVTYKWIGQWGWQTHTFTAFGSDEADALVNVEVEIVRYFLKHMAHAE